VPKPGKVVYVVAEGASGMEAGCSPGVKSGVSTARPGVGKSTAARWFAAGYTLGEIEGCFCGHP
jgi:hypothetical protein